MLQTKDSDLTLKLFHLALRQQLIKINYVPAENRHAEAAEAFRILGASASNAVPELINIYSPNKSAESQGAILASLGAIGPSAKSAIPLLLRSVTTNTNLPVWESSLWSLGSIHAEPEVVVPVLTNFLRSPDSDARFVAAGGLGKFGSDATPATSAILELLKDQNSSVRDAAVHALSRIYSKPEWDPPESSESKAKYKSSTLTRVINGFGAMGTNAAPAIPALVKFLADPEEDVRTSATNALKAIDPEAVAKEGE